MSRSVCLSFLLVMSLVFTSSCGNDDNGTPLPAMTQIAKGEASSGTNFRQADRIIDNQEDWTRWLSSLTQFVDKSDSLIDFNKYIVVLVSDALRGSSGYSIEIEEVVEAETTVRLKVRHRGPEGESTAGMYQPFHIVKIPKPAKPLDFEHTAAPPRIYYSSVLRGHLSGHEGIEKQDIVITNQSDWAGLLERMNSYFQSPDFPDKVPQTEIDFSRFMVLATFDRVDCVYPDPCPALIFRDVTDIIETDSSISVLVQNLDISVVEGYPEPFHIVKIPVSAKPVVFEYKAFPW